MTNEEVELAERSGLFMGTKQTFALEHRLVAAKKYGPIGRGTVVRHVNGNKSDNRPENLVIGSIAENNSDHHWARLMMLYWKDRAVALDAECAKLREVLLAVVPHVRSGEALQWIEGALREEAA